MKRFTKFALVLLLVLSISMTLALAMQEQQLTQSDLLIPRAEAAESSAAAANIVVAATEAANEKNGAADTTTGAADAAITEETESDSDWSISDILFNNISTIVITVLGLAMCIYLYITNNRVK